MSWEPNEDTYWEGIRERMERDKDPVYDTDILFVDDELEEIEEHMGASIEDLSEEDLLKIVEDFLQIQAKSAKWRPRLMGIEYIHQIA